jgi:NNP family nitrate/nitrite transporter-like MFS transporter
MVEIGVREDQVSSGRRGRQMLALASIGYFTCVWAWGLLSPLAPVLRDAAATTGFEQALVVAVPVLVGCLGRIPVGALTDRFGGRRMFVAVTGVAIAALVLFAVGGYRSTAGLIVGAGLLGLAGTSFAVAVPFVSGWFPGAGRGLAVGVLGMGICGSAAAGLTAVRWAEAYGVAVPFVISAAALAVFGVAVILVGHDAPRRQLPGYGFSSGLVAALRLRVTWRAGGWYSVHFGIFVAFSVYLPVYLSNAYGVAAAEGGVWLAGFVVVTVLARPLGGWLSDRLSPLRPLAMALAVLAAAVAVQAFEPPLQVAAGLTMPAMAVAVGAGSSAVLAQVASAVPPPMVGLVSGLVTAAAGLAGFAAPLVMAASYGWYHSYRPAVTLFAVCAVLALWRVARAARREST